MFLGTGRLRVYGFINLLKSVVKYRSTQKFHYKKIHTVHEFFSWKTSQIDVSLYSLHLKTQCINHKLVFSDNGIFLCSEHFKFYNIWCNVKDMWGLGKWGIYPKLQNLIILYPPLPVLEKHEDTCYKSSMCVFQRNKHCTEKLCKAAIEAFSNQICYDISDFQTKQDDLLWHKQVHKINTIVNA